MRFPATMLDFWCKVGRFRAVVPMMVSICIICTGTGLITLSTSLRLSGPEIDASTVQIVLTAFPVGFAVGCLIARRLVAALGHEKSFIAVCLLIVLAAAGLSLSGSAASWSILRFFNGVGIAAIFVICESWINLYADDRNRGRYFSFYMMMTVLSSFFSQLLVEAVGPHSLHLFEIAGAAIVLGLAFSMLVGGRWPPLPELPSAQQTEISGPPVQSYGLRQLVLIAPVTMICIFQAGITNTNVFVMTPIYGARIGIDAVTTVALITAFSFGSIVAQMPVGWLSDRFDRRVILLVQASVAAFSCAMIAWLGDTMLPLLFVLFFAYGACAMTIYPVAIAFANSRLESRHMVAAAGAFLLVYSIANVMTPGGAALLMEHTAPQALFFLLGGGAALVAAAAGHNLLTGPRRDGVAAPVDNLVEPAND